MELIKPILFIAIAVMVGVVVLAVVLKVVLGAGKQGHDAADYELKSSLLSPAERSFLGVLESIDLGDLQVQSKVRMADFVGVARGLSRSQWQRAFNRISSKHIDFLLIQKSDGKPVVGIELDDQTHQRANRAKRDQFVDSVYESIRLPIVHIRAQATYNPREIMQRIEEAITHPEDDTS